WSRPPVRTRSRPWSWCSRSAAAICDRPALWMQTKRTSGTLFTSTPFARPDDQRRWRVLFGVPATDGWSVERFIPCPLGIDLDRYSDIGFFIDRCQYGSVDVSVDGMDSVGSARPPGPLPIVQDAVACSPSILAAALDELEAAELARSFAALADPARLRLFSLIAAQPGGEVCACALVEPLGRSQPTVSHHLKVLYEAGLVDRERRGNWIWYWVVRDRLEALR